MTMNKTFSDQKYLLLEIRLPQNLAKLDLVICDLCAKTKTHCASYIVDVTADRTK